MTPTSPDRVAGVHQLNVAGDNDQPRGIDNTTILDDGSDYGEFANNEEELIILDDLLSQIASQAPNDALVVTDIEDYEAPRGVFLPKILGVEQSMRQRQVYSQDTPQVLRDETSHPEDRTVLIGTIAREPSPTEASEPDTRSPIERFRGPPKKSLSVTDLVSPSWCELQYFYTLAKHGRKRRTPAMKQGTAVHKALEDEVHVTVPVRIKKKEDSWGLRIWNIIQGLKTLRHTGRTRELEIWGSLGGEIVNGVIDELSYTCPDPQLEEKTSQSTNAGQDVGLPEYQTSITEYLLSAEGSKERQQSVSNAMTSVHQAHSKPSKQRQEEKCIYITDVKTRATPTLPTGASIRPTVLQLHLYHHMLENFAQGNFSLVLLAERHKFDTNETFSDSFIAQIGNLNQDLFDEVASQDDFRDGAPPQILSSQDSMDILLQHNNLSSLWEFMLLQFRNTFILPLSLDEHNTTPTPTPQSVSDLPQPDLLPTRLSPILTAEYLAPTYQHTKKPIGSKSFVFNPAFLKSYLEDNLAWWRGERAARGVELQEAWKCRSCDFRDDCAWIHERDAAAVAEARDRKKMREVAGVEKTSARKSASARSQV